MSDALVWSPGHYPTKPHLFWLSIDTQKHNRKQTPVRFISWISSNYPQRPHWLQTNQQNPWTVNDHPSSRRARTDRQTHKRTEGRTDRLPHFAVDKDTQESLQGYQHFRFCMETAFASFFFKSFQGILMGLYKYDVTTCMFRNQSFQRTPE